MRASTILLGAVATLVSPQRMADSLPDCAVDCLENGIESATDCSVDDGDCICEVDNYRNTYDASTACVLQACGAAKALDEVLPAAARFCSEVTDGATAPPVDDSPSATSTGPAASSTDATTTSTPTASPTESSAEAGQTEEPDAASLVGPAGMVGFAALVLSLAILL